MRLWLPSCEAVTCILWGYDLHLVRLRLAPCQAVTCILWGCDLHLVRMRLELVRQLASCEAATCIVWGCNVNRVRLQCASCEVQCASCEAAMCIVWGCNVHRVRMQRASCEAATCLQLHCTICNNLVYCFTILMVLILQPVAAAIESHNCVWLWKHFEPLLPEITIEFNTWIYAP